MLHRKLLPKKAKLMIDYRTTIYKNCNPNCQGLEPAFDPLMGERWGRAYDYYLRGWLPEKKNAAIVDLACGNGKLLYFFKERGYKNITGVDISPGQVQLARQVIPEVYQMDVIDFLGSYVNSFDLITGLDIIEHLQKDEILRFLGLCHRALRKGGRLILQTPNADSPLSTSIRYGDFTHEVCFNPNVLLGLLHLCKFNQVEVREQGPVPLGYSIVSTIRYAIWQIIRMGLKLWNFAETGGPGSGLFTRVLIVSGNS